MADTALYQDVICDEVTFDSADGRSTIHACVWRPEGLPERDGLLAPRAVVQVVHGMSEHVRRYDEFARYLNKRGYIVFGASSARGDSSSAETTTLATAAPLTQAGTDAFRRTAAQTPW